jgi:hypothetical protein
VKKSLYLKKKDLLVKNNFLKTKKSFSKITLLKNYPEKTNIKNKSVQKPTQVGQKAFASST